MRAFVHRCLAVLTTVAFCAAPAAAAQSYALNGGVPNLQLVENQILAYYTSGRQEADVARVDRRAREYVLARLKQGVKRPAVVFDIDDTALSSFAYEKSVDFVYTPKSWDAWEQADRFPAIPATLALTRFLRAHHVAVFFVTGRRQPEAASTLRELEKAGYAAPAGLYLRPTSDHRHSVIPFKSSARAAIAAKGYDIIESIGDQWSDLRGGHAERLYKLPNPMYYLP